MLSFLESVVIWHTPSVFMLAPVSLQLSKLEKTPSDRFDEIEAAIHANLVNDIEAYKSSLMADHGFFERMLTSMGIKKSYTRDQTLWLCKLILIFFASGSVGIGFAKIDDRLKQVIDLPALLLTCISRDAFSELQVGPRIVKNMCLYTLHIVILQLSGHPVLQQNLLLTQQQPCKSFYHTTIDYTKGSIYGSKTLSTQVVPLMSRCKLGIQDAQFQQKHYVDADQFALC